MTRLLLLVAFLLAVASPAFAVTRDAFSTGEKGGTGTTLTASHVVTAAGGNRALFLFCGIRSITITLSATFNGVTMSEVRHDVTASNEASWVFQLTNPATGTHDWVVTESSELSLECYAVSATNVNQVSPITDHDGACVTSTTSTLTLTTAANELIWDVMLVAGESITLLQGANQTDEIDPPSESVGSTWTIGGSRQAAADGGIMSWTWTGTLDGCQSAISVAHSLYSRAPSSPIFLGN